MGLDEPRLQEPQIVVEAILEPGAGGRLAAVAMAREAAAVAGRSPLGADAGAALGLDSTSRLSPRTIFLMRSSSLRSSSPQGSSSIDARSHSRLGSPRVVR